VPTMNVDAKAPWFVPVSVVKCFAATASTQTDCVICAQVPTPKTASLRAPAAQPREESAAASVARTQPRRKAKAKDKGKDKDKGKGGDR